MKKIRWGLLSTARINQKLIPAIRGSQTGELTAVASRKPKTASDYAKEWNIPFSFGSYEDMLASDKIDAVYISLPNHLHKEWSIKAMQSGKHVLCEKPMTVSLSDMDEMIDVSQKTKIRLAEAFMYRHHPQMKLVGEWVRSGDLGDISVVRGAFNFALHQHEDIRMIPDFGGGCLWDVGIYPLSFVQYVMGEPPIEVSGAKWVGPTGVDSSFVGQMRFSGDRLAQITSSFRTPRYTQVEILGTKGRIVLNRPFVDLEKGGTFLFYPADSDPEGSPKVIKIPEKELYLGEIEDMNDAILEGKENYLSLEESRNHVRTILALYESAKTQRFVRL